MEISFATGRLQKLCESTKKLQQKHGADCARKVAVRLSDLRAAENLGEFRRLPGRCHELAGDRDGQLALDLTDGKRLIFEPADDPVPLDEGGGLSWSGVTAVRVLEIADYH